MSEERVTAGQVHASTYPVVKRLYRSVGWTMCARPVESDDGEKQPRVDLAASDLLTVAVPAGEILGHMPRSAAVESLGETGNVPVFLRGEHAVLVYSAPGLSKDAPRQLALDASLGDAAACYRALHGESNPGLPCQGSRESWLTLCAPTAAPQWLLDLCAQLTVDEKATDQEVCNWLRAMFEPTIPRSPNGWLKHEAGAAVEGLSRDEIHHLLCKATGWTSNDFSPERLSRCADACMDLICKHRSNKGGSAGNGGYLWLVRRKPGVTLRAPNGVNVETIDGTLLELARSLHLVRENHPARVRARKQEQEFAEQRAHAAAEMRRRFGSEEVRDLLLVKQSTGGAMGDRYLDYHNRQEYRRKQACDAQGLLFRPLPLSEARAEWWTEHDLNKITWPELYCELVQRYAVAKEVA